MLWTVALPVLSGSALQLAPVGVSLDGPPALAKALATANGALIHAGQCGRASYPRGVKFQLEKTWKRYEVALRAAAGIWGYDAFPEFDQIKFGPLRCGPADIARMIKDAGAAMDHAEETLAEATAPMMQGAWVGPLKLCGNTVAKAERGTEELFGQPMVLITLQPRAAALFSSLTDRLVNWWVEIRLDGEVISEPGIYERIDSGQFQVAGPEAPELDRLIAAVNSPC